MIDPKDIQSVISKLHQQVVPLIPAGVVPVGREPTGDPECPGTTVELLKKLEEIFTNQLPPVEVYKRTPEILWLLYGQQNVLNWIRTRITHQNKS